MAAETPEPLELFYVYAHKDKPLLKRLEKHLASLKRNGLISTWHDLEILPGSLWKEQLDAHLEAAQIILLLVSSDFMDSDYCYSVGMQRALQRHIAGMAHVIPVILKPVDWKEAPFAKFSPLPRDAKPITTWSNRDAAFADVAAGIRRVVNILNGLAPDAVLYTDSKRSTKGKSMDEEVIVSTPGALTPLVLKKAADRYQKDLKVYDGKANYELALRPAFQNMLADMARRVNWTLIPELTIKGGIRPDGVLLDAFKMERGYWEAKGPESNLEQEISRKIQAGYPLTNTLFENTQRAILYQNKRRVPVVFDLRKTDDVRDLLHQFLTYAEPEIAGFEEAVQEFKGRIPELAQKLLDIIDKEYLQNRNFITAFDSFTELCRTSLNPQIGKADIKEMLVQHLLTERLFRTVFNNSDFVNRNVIAAEIEKVIRALAGRAFNRQDFLKSLDRFYVAIEAAAKGREDWSERQHFLNTVYERFFQGFSAKHADTLGTVYTPQEIVDFMVESVDEVLKREFGKSIQVPGVKILDPATGTGNFIVNILRRIQSRGDLQKKYANDLFCNEITLLPYYIASLNIEHEYFERMGQYEPFEGICFADTLELAEGQQMPLFVEENTGRVEREKAAEIMVVVGNPPWNVGQRNENDNNKNRRYPLIDSRVGETYAKFSRATNKNALSDAYIKFFRWAADRLGQRDGIVCFVSNNGFLNGIAFDGFRKALLQDFSQIYHLDLKGNARTSGERRRAEGGNIFDDKIRTGVGITILVRSSSHTEKKVWHYAINDYWTARQKRGFLASCSGLRSIPWEELVIDKQYNWLVESLPNEFDAFYPLGNKESKLVSSLEVKVVFKSYGRGVATCRDDWAYDFNLESLQQKIKRFIDVYNGEVDRWGRRGTDPTSVDNFVIYDDTKIKWSESLKSALQRHLYGEFSKAKIRTSLYRPFCKQFLYFDRLLNERVYQFPQIFPTSNSEQENIVFCVTGIGSNKPFHCLATNFIPGLDLIEKTQCFPYYTYAPDGTARRENITDWALAQFQARYGPDVSKWQIFYYVYGMLHHPQYRERYAENLKRDLPHIPLLARGEAFLAAVSIGKQLMEMHISYEQVDEYALKEFDNGALPYELSRRVEKMKLSADRTALIVNKSLTLDGIPPECFQYRLGNRSALEWVIDQYQVSKDARSGIESDPNRLDEPEYIVSLVKRVVTVSVRTVALVNELAGAVTLADWLEETGAV